MGFWRNLFAAGPATTSERADPPPSSESKHAGASVSPVDPKSSTADAAAKDWSAIPSKMARLGDNFGCLDDRTIHALLLRIQYEQEMSLVYDVDRVFGGAAVGHQRMELSAIEGLLRQRGVEVGFLHSRHGEGYGKSCYVDYADEICISWSGFSNYVFVSVKPVAERVAARLQDEESMMRERKMSRAIQAAGTAFRSGKYDVVISELAPFEQTLPASQIKKLQIARARNAGGESTPSNVT